MLAVHSWELYKISVAFYIAVQTEASGASRCCNEHLISFRHRLVLQCWQHTWNGVGGYLAGIVFRYNVTDMLVGVISDLVKHCRSETWTNLFFVNLQYGSFLFQEVVQIVYCADK